MAYSIETSERARRSIKRLPSQVVPRVTEAIRQLAENPRPHGAIKLQGNSDEWRIRVGDYRVIYEIHDDRLVVVVIRAAHRREAY